MADFGGSGEKVFIAVAGNIGSGKTTLTQKLSEHMGTQSYFESVLDNPYLSDFYQNMSRWSFPLQIYFLKHRYTTHLKIQNCSLGGVQDRTIYEDAHVFARALFEQGLLQERDYQTYLGVYESMIQNLRPPTLMIFLRRSVPKLLQRIQGRARPYEKDLSRDYLEVLNGLYDRWFDEYKLGKFLLVDTDEVDFLNNESHFDRLMGSILETFDQQQLSFYF